MASPPSRTQAALTVTLPEAETVLAAGAGLFAMTAGPESEIASAVSQGP